MLKNYLTIALRTLQRHRGYTFINIAGLGLGLAACLLILLYVQDERSYDRYHTQGDRIYRVAAGTEGETIGGHFRGIARVSGPWAPNLQADLPEVEQAVRFQNFGNTLFRYEQESFYLSGGFATDGNVFQVFDYGLRQGDPATALTQPNSIVLTASLAERLFGDRDAMGRVLDLSGTEYTVTGVMADVPTQSHFTFPFLVSLTSFPADGLQANWQRAQFYTYVLLASGATPEALAAKIPGWLAGYVGDEHAEGVVPILQPLYAIYLTSDLFREIGPTGNAEYLAIFSVVALFILLIACVNFMNLATARAAQRAREVGVRKTAGASRAMLVVQFLGEAVVLTALAAVLALGLVSLLLPLFNELTQKTLTMAALLQPAFVLGLLGLVISVGVLAGSYPAFVLSGFRPAAVLKGSFQLAGNARLRQGLVVVQFALSAFLLIATGIVFQQLDFIQGKDLGFNQEQLVVIPIRDNVMREQAETVKARLRALPGVAAVSASANMPGGTDYGIPIQPEGIPDDERPTTRILVIDEDFLDTYEMELAEGRNFSEDFSTDAGGAFLLNETAVQALGWDGVALEKQVAMLGVGIGPSPVVGVVRDFHFRSMHEEIGPLVFMLPPQPAWLTYYTLRLRPERLTETLAAVEETWAQFDAENPMTYQFFDEQFGALHEAEGRMGTLLSAFTLLALFIACLGLFGLTAFTTQQRTKEIGVRKVLGASVPSIVLMLSKDVTRPVLIALVIAAPLAYYVMQDWLTNFAYRVGLDPWLFAVAALAALGIAWGTIAYQSIRAATANPVRSLRYE